MRSLVDGGLGSFFGAAEGEFELVAGAQGVVVRDLRFADRRVRLRFAGATLAGALLPALSAREEDHRDEVDVSICLWERDRSPHDPVPFPWSIEEIGPGGLIQGSDPHSVIAIHETASGALTLADRHQHTILYRVPAEALIPWWERAAPLRPALHWALRGEHRHLVHAGAVGDTRGGVLLAGASGSGKTTVALAALEHGLGYLADDYILLNTTQPPTAHAIYTAAKLDEGHRARFRRLAKMVRYPPPEAAEEKAVLDVARLMPGSVRESLPVRAVLVPRIRSGHARLTPITPTEALLALAPSTVFQMPFDDGAVLASLANLVRTVPCFALEVGEHTTELAHAIEQTLEQT